MPCSLARSSSLSSSRLCTRAMLCVAAASFNWHYSNGSRLGHLMVRGPVQI